MRRKSAPKLRPVCYRKPSSLTALCQGFNFTGPPAMTDDPDQVTCSRCLLKLATKNKGIGRAG